MLFDIVFSNPDWADQDDFPSSVEWKTEIDKWLEFIDNKGELDRYVSRLNSTKTQRDETLAEIVSRQKESDELLEDAVKREGRWSLLLRPISFLFMLALFALYFIELIKPLPDKSLL